MIDNNKIPLVSIGVPVFNGSQTLRRALDSLVSQSWPNIEIIICDDVSSDNSVAICEEFSSCYKFIYFEKNVQNLGEDGYGNLKKILSISKGKYFFWASQDDVWHPEFVNDLTCMLEADTEAVAAMCAIEYFFENKGKRHTKSIHIPYKSDWPQNNIRLINAGRILFQKGIISQLRKDKHPDFVLFHFIHGIVRLDVFQKSLFAIHNRISNEQEVVSQWALAGKLLYCDNVLFYKEVITIFICIDIDSSDLINILDSKNLKEYKRRQERKKLFQKLKPSKIKYYYDIMKVHLRSEVIPIIRKPQSVILFLAFLVSRAFRPLFRLFTKQSLNRKFNLLQNESEKPEGASEKTLSCHSGERRNP